MFKVPISRKAVAAVIAGLVGAGLQAVGVYDVSPAVQGVISSVEALAAAIAVGDGVKYANYLAQRIGLPVSVDVEP